MNEPQSASDRAAALRTQGLLHEALAAYEESLRLFPDNAVARNGRAKVLRDLGRYDEALAAYDEAVARFPDDAVAHNGRAEVLKGSGRLDEALAAYDVVVKLFPESPVVRNGRAEVLMQMGRLDEALAAYKETADLFPDSGAARDGREATLSELERPGEPVLDELMGGVEAPPDPAVVDVLNTRDDRDNEEGMEGGVKLAEVLARQTFSKLAGSIFRRAIDLASERGPSRQILTSSCILFAMAEVGRHEGDAGDAAQFLRGWFDMYYPEAYDREFRRLMDAEQAAEKQQASSTVSPTDEVVTLMTPSAVRVVETAARIAKYVTNTGSIYARHLLGALLLEATRHEGEVRRRLMSMGASLDDLGEKYYDFVKDPNNDEDDLTRWRRLLFGGAALPGEEGPGATVAPYLPPINADSATGEDLLQIKGEVEGFANIIAAADVKPPLSIGLFGDWGSGKSFFISKLKEKVTEITKQVRRKKEGEPTAYLSNVIQIDFNAWHYVDANLWASIVSHVFDNLNLTDEKEERKAEERKRFLLEHLDTTLKARTEAVRSVADKTGRLEQAQAELSQKEKELGDRQGQLEAERLAQKETRLGLRALLREGVWPRVREYLREDEQAGRQLDEAYDKLGLEGAAENLAEAKRQVSAALTVAGRAQLQLNTVVKSRDVRRRALWLLAVLIAVPLVLTLFFVLVGRWQNLGSLLTWAGEMLALVVGVYKFVKPKVDEALARAGGVLDQLEGANRQLDRLYKQAEEKRNSEIAAAEREVEQQRAGVEAKRDEVEAKRAEVEAARRNLTEVEKQRDDTLASLSEMDPAQMLARFIEERASSKDYRQHLGIVALVHQDFKKLSKLMFGQDDKDRLKELREAVEKMFRDNKQEPPADLNDELEKYRIDRIVLYIDDLDRCPPKQVVDVLQAIHLLLAFQLFVVVVGVDARWVRHSLKERYPGMLVGGDDGDDKAAAHGVAATPGDYIEKIFQVPFWLKPMGAGGSADLLRGLIPDTQLLKGNGNVEAGAGQTGAGGSVQAGPPAGGAGGARMPSAASTQVSTGGATFMVEGQTGTQGVGAPGGGTPGGAAPLTTGAASQPAAQSNGGGGDDFSLRPEGLLLEEKERDAMVSLSEVIGRTPRTLKRFVNVYRIIRAGLKGKTLDDFKGTTPRDGQYRAVLVLLGVAHGKPDFAPPFFKKLKEKYATLSAEEEKHFGLRAFLDELSDRQRTPPDTVPEGWHDTMRELKKFTRGSDDIPLGVLREWAPLVVRYTFHHGHLSEDVS